jgi:ElaB/YqjD/DUF883 family membrane-anchored ribosome-binding protein
MRTRNRWHVRNLILVVAACNLWVLACDAVILYFHLSPWWTMAVGPPFGLVFGILTCNRYPVRVPRESK